MKEQKIIEMKNKVEVLGQVLQGQVQENDYLRTMVVGLTALIKNMPGYEEAVKKTIEENNKKKDELEQ
jgi:hypothetical protein